jgi:hypothetical protein
MYALHREPISNVRSLPPRIEQALFSHELANASPCAPQSKPHLNRMLPIDPHRLLVAFLLMGPLLIDRRSSAERGRQAAGWT